MLPAGRDKQAGLGGQACKGETPLGRHWDQWVEMSSALRLAKKRGQCDIQTALWKTNASFLLLFYAPIHAANMKTCMLF